MACCPGCELGMKTCPGKPGNFMPMEDALAAEAQALAVAGQAPERLGSSYGSQDRWTLYEAVLVSESKDADSRLPSGFYFPG